MGRRLLPLLASVTACAFLLVGCGASDRPQETARTNDSPAPSAPATASSEPVAAETEPEPAASQSEPETPSSASEVPTATVPKASPVVQEETCDWDSAPLSGVGAVPAGPGDTELASALVGAWQHTAIDSGSGFEPLGATTDIRYVFPSTQRLLYCQDVKGATSQAENAADISLQGADIMLPGNVAGYTVTAWDAGTMVWKNNRDDSLYLLQRR